MEVPLPSPLADEPQCPGHEAQCPVFMGQPLNLGQACVGGTNSRPGLSISWSVPPDSSCGVTLSSPGCLERTGAVQSGNEGSCVIPAPNKYLSVGDPITMHSAQITACYLILLQA